MARPKKDAGTSAEAEGAAAPPASDAEKKPSAGRGRPKGTANKTKVDAPRPVTTRSLRSNSKPSLVEEPAQKVVKEKQPSKSKAKKPTEAVETNGSEKTEVIDEDNVADTEIEPIVEKEEKKGKKAGVAEKGGKKKAAATNGATTNEEENKSESTEETSKPVKSGKKKAEAAPPADDEGNGSSEPEPETAEKPKSSAGRGKKKTEKAAGETVAPKKAKKTEATEETEESNKPKPAEKKGKGKATTVKEVTVEHWNAERVKNILQPFCNPSVAFYFNKKAPRRGSFEITLLKENNEEKTIWSGIKRGPPRKEKFPTDEEVLKLADTHFSHSL